jgi:hypothetical protein
MIAPQRHFVKRVHRGLWCACEDAHERRNELAYLTAIFHTGGSEQANMEKTMRSNLLMIWSNLTSVMQFLTVYCSRDGKLKGKAIYVHASTIRRTD